MELKLGSFSLFLLGCVLLAAGVVGGTMVERYTMLRCVIESKEFSAKTVVCDDGQVYRLVQEDAVAEEQKLDNLDSRLKAVEAVVTPAQPEKK